MSGSTVRRPQLDDGVRRWWADELGPWGDLLTVVLAPLAWIFSAGSRLRNWTFDRGFRRVDEARIPVISIGNLSVGGTGKTPFSAWCTRQLSESGALPALVTRGYGQDEVALHRRWQPDIPVFVAARRIEGVRAATEAGRDCAVVDDGFQHRQLARGLDVVLVAAEQGLQGRRLPRGPFREGPSALGRADVVVVTRKSAAAERAVAVAGHVASWAPNAVVGRIALRGGAWVELDLQTPAKGPPADASVVVLASVANPLSVRELAAARLGRDPHDVALLTFPDHHEYAESDQRAIEQAAADRWIVTTEKDAVKLGSLIGRPVADRVRVLRLELEWEAGEVEVRRALLRAGLRAGLARSPAESRRHPLNESSP